VAVIPLDYFAVNKFAIIFMQNNRTIS